MPAIRSQMLRTSLTEKLRVAATHPHMNTKRNTKHAHGREAWFPYYAGYPEKFVEIILDQAALKKGAVVLDPWNGSGTTTSIASYRGFNSIGIDINPVAVLVASAKISGSRDNNRNDFLIEKICQLATREPNEQDASSDSLSKWLPLDVVSIYRAIEQHILCNIEKKSTVDYLNPAMMPLSPTASFFILALMRAARSISTMRTASNPTWIRPGVETDCRPDHLIKAWKYQISNMSANLDLNASEDFIPSNIILGDSRNIELEDEMVDLIITSPPYCTRVDYIKSTSFELAALGISDGDVPFELVRRSCMGSTLVRNATLPEIPNEWPIEIKDTLSHIRNHASKASGSYYYKTYWQYFDDLIQSVGELKRCLKFNGSIVMVVQTSYYKDVLIDVPKLLIATARTHGLNGSTVSCKPVHNGLFQINRKAKEYALGRQYAEAVICLEPYND
jgi:DNA modification methylase